MNYLIKYNVNNIYKPFYEPENDLKNKFAISRNLETPFEALTDRSIDAKFYNIRRERLYKDQLVKMVQEHEMIDKIICYVNKNLPSIFLGNGKELHIRPNLIGHPFSIDINSENKIIICLKFDKKLGQGAFKTVKKALMFSNEGFTAVARSTETFESNTQKICSNNELKILKKISDFLDINPTSKGLLRFYGSTDYESKYEFLPGRQTLKKLSLSESKVENDKEINIENLPQYMQKRAMISKLYKNNLMKARFSLTPTNLLEATMQILEGLSTLHRLKIFHSDLKLDNILINYDKNSYVEAVIGDYGFSCDLTNSEDCFYKSGCKAFLAPELKEIIKKNNWKGGQPINEDIFASDIYAMGSLLENLFYNHSNFSLFEPLIKQMKEDKPYLRPSAEIALQGFIQISSQLENISLSKKYREENELKNNYNFQSKLFDENLKYNKRHNQTDQENINPNILKSDELSHSLNLSECSLNDNEDYVSYHESYVSGDENEDYVSYKGKSISCEKN